jgi:O-antigen/teichoic acid export membrane protein
MSTGVNLPSTPGGPEGFLPPSSDLEEPPAMASIPPVAAPALPEAAPAPRRMPFGLKMSSDKTVFQAFLSLADQAIASATSFITGIIIARACSKEELGLYMLGFSLIFLMTDFQTSLITTPYMVYAPRLKGRDHALYTGSTLIHQLAFCFLTTVGVLIAAVVVGHGYGGAGRQGLGPVLWALSLVISLIMLREHARRVSFARLQLLTAFLFDTSIAVGQLAGLLLLAHYHLLSATRAYWLVGLVCGVAVLGWLWTDREFYHPRLGESLRDLKKNWVFGKWVFASGLVWALSMNLYPWFLAYFHGTASTGIWAACNGVVSVGNPALLGIQNIVGPKIAHAYAELGPKGLRRVVLRITMVMFLPISALCVILMVWGGRLIALLYGKQYAGNDVVVAILALSFLVYALAFSFSRALMAIERADLDFLLNFVALFIMVSVGFWLVRAYGPVGAAIGVFLAMFASSAVRAVVFLRLPVQKPLAGAAE